MAFPQHLLVSQHNGYSAVKMRVWTTKWLNRFPWEIKGRFLIFLAIFHGGSCLRNFKCQRIIAIYCPLLLFWQNQDSILYQLSKRWCLLAETLPIRSFPIIINKALYCSVVDKLPECRVSALYGLCNLNRVGLCSSADSVIQALPKLSCRRVLQHAPTSSSRPGTSLEQVLAPSRCCARVSFPWIPACPGSDRVSTQGSLLLQLGRDIPRKHTQEYLDLKVWIFLEF